MLDTDNDCKCAMAMETSYRTLRDRNYSDLRAFDVAVSIYRYHHPNKTKLEARQEAASILDALTAG